MKKIIWLVITLLFCSSFAYAETSKEFSFSWSVFDALHLCQWAMDYELKEGDELVKMMSDSILANDKFEGAKTLIKQYVNDKDETISVVASGMSTGIEILIDGNNKLIDKMRKASNLDPKGFTDLEYDMASIRAQNKKGWETLALAAAWVLPVLVEPAKSENPTGPLPFKISKEERQQLLKRLSELFQDKLKRYSEYKALQKEGKEGNPDDQTWLIFTVAHIKDNLSCETYEQAKEIENKSQ